MAKHKDYHIPVMRDELIKHLQLNKGKVILDCTVGCAGHADAVLRGIGPEGRLVGIDRDHEALELAAGRLEKFSNYTLVQGNFRNLDRILAQCKISHVDGIIFDLGVSSLQLDSAQRGFSFRLDAPLDMRMDKALKISAFDLVNFLPQEGLAEIFKKYGQERWHNRIARAIVRERKKSVIVSTAQLSRLVAQALPYRYSRINPATRTFQALRIAVNDELDSLTEALGKCINVLKPEGRICVISFHSLEDRIVKQQFRNFSRQKKLRIITKKPQGASAEEAARNPRARSAKMRVAERTAEGM